MPLPDIMVAPNGARLQKTDHSNLPITIPEMVETAAACFAAGADGLHIHIRKPDGGHLLDHGLYREALGEIGAVVPDMQLQITTEAAGVYKPAHQRNVALQSGANSVSASVREMMNDEAGKSVLAFYRDCDAQGIALQHIIYNNADLEMLRAILDQSNWRPDELHLLFVLGSYIEKRDATSAELAPLVQQLDAFNTTVDWAACAFGRAETQCLGRAHELGGKIRVGFENSVWNLDGTRADSNAERVRDVRQYLKLGSEF